MKKSVLITFFYLTCGLAILPALATESTPSYNQLWSKVDSLEREGLTRQAYSQVGEILTSAIREKLDKTALRAVIYEMRYGSELEEDDYVLAINKLDSLNRIMPSPAKEIVHSILAEVYWTYYQQNAWKINGRTYVADMDLTDFRTWDTKRLALQVRYHYFLSLGNAPLLKLVPIDEYETFISGERESMALRPSLYDFLAHRALDFVQNYDLDIEHNAGKFTLNNPDYFNSNGDFVLQEFVTTDTFNTKYYALLLYQDLIRFHQKLNQPKQLFQLELERLQFLRSAAAISNSEELFFHAIERLAFSNGYHLYAAEAWAEYGRFLYNRDSNYNNGNGSDYQWDRKAALIICQRVHEHFRGSYGDEQCIALEKEIMTHTLSINAQQAIPADKKSNLLVNYQNFVVGGLV